MIHKILPLIISSFSAVNASLIIESPDGDVITNTHHQISTSCPQESSIACQSDTIGELMSLLNFATQNYCITNELEMQNSGVNIPDCPEEGPIQGIDNTHPTGGAFVLYHAGNKAFIHDLVTSYIENTETGRFNVIIHENFIEELTNQPELLEALNHPRVNIINLPSVGQNRLNLWIRDQFQFINKNGQPAILQIEYPRDNEYPIADRMACQISQECNIPYYTPENFSFVGNPFINSSLDMGGNLEVLPGGTFMRGVMGDSRHAFRNHWIAEDPTLMETPYQRRLKETLEENGNRVIDIDVSFSEVSHVDEIFNPVRTNSPPPCDYAILMASPRKAIELLEQQVQASSSTLSTTEEQRQTCRDYNYANLRNRFVGSLVDPAVVNEVYNSHCIDGFTLQEFVAQDEYEILKEYNLTGNPEFENLI